MQTKHPKTDAHLAACASCMMEHDKRLPDAQEPRPNTWAGVTFNGFHLATVARLAREMGSPINGAFAEFVWRLSNSAALPISYAVQLMQEAGYEPFKGFPLRRRLN